MKKLQNFNLNADKWGKIAFNLSEVFTKTTLGLFMGLLLLALIVLNFFNVHIEAKQVADMIPLQSQYAKSVSLLTAASFAGMLGFMFLMNGLRVLNYKSDIKKFMKFDPHDMAMIMDSCNDYMKKYIPAGVIFIVIDTIIHWKLYEASVAAVTVPEVQALLELDPGLVPAVLMNAKMIAFIGVTIDAAIGLISPATIEESFFIEGFEQLKKEPKKEEKKKEESKKEEKKEESTPPKEKKKEDKVPYVPTQDERHTIQTISKKGRIPFKSLVDKFEEMTDTKRIEVLRVFRTFEQEFSDLDKSKANIHDVSEINMTIKTKKEELQKFLSDVGLK